MKTLIGVQQVHHFKAAVFQIPTTSGDVFMYQERSNYMNEENAVVEVDAKRFLALWRAPNSSHPEIAMGNPETWPSDYKFHWSEDHFSQGRRNPVPLAQVSCRVDSYDKPVWRRKLMLFKSLDHVETVTIPSLHFTDGITRTIWLLSHGAKHFPVYCSMAEAPLLQKLVGVEGSRFCSVHELVPAAAHVHQ